MSNFSDRLETAREELGLKGNAFAEALGIPYRSYMNYKGGRTPPAEVLSTAIESLGINPAWLMKGELPILSETTASEPARPQAERPAPSATDLAALSGFDHADENLSPQDVQLRLLKHLMDLHEENSRLRQRVEELEILLHKSRSRTRKLNRDSR